MRFGHETAALDEGRAAVPTTGWTATRVSGAGAIAWLNDLVTADIERLGPDEAVRSLLLSPTGRIRADLLIARWGDALVALQSPGQPHALADLLAPYVLSSDVVLEPVSADVLLVGGARGWRLASDAPSGHLLVEPAALESWRIRRGIARFPVDLDEESLPAEAELDREPVIDREKGCYLGQESVARVRNLGHPTRLVVPVAVDGPASPGDRVRSGPGDVGLLTSLDDGTGLVRIRWGARESELTTETGSPLRTLRPPSG